MSYNIVNLEIMIKNINNIFNIEIDKLQNLLLKVNHQIKSLKSKKLNLKLAKDNNNNNFFLLSNIHKTNYYAFKILNKI